MKINQDYPQSVFNKKPEYALVGFLTMTLQFRYLSRKLLLLINFKNIIDFRRSWSNKRNFFLIKNKDLSNLIFWISIVFYLTIFRSFPHIVTFFPLIVCFLLVLRRSWSITDKMQNNPNRKTVINVLKACCSIVFS